MAASGRKQHGAGGPAGGFTLIEILFVVVLIAILAAVALPLFRRGRAAANEAAVIKAMRVLQQAEMQYRLESNTYGTLAELGSEGKGFLNDAALSKGTRNGYRFVLAVDSESAWHVAATPLTYGTDGVMTYYIDESGQLRGSDLGRSDVPTRAVAETWRTVN